MESVAEMAPFSKTVLYPPGRITEALTSILSRGRALFGEGGHLGPYRLHANSEYPEVILGRHTAGANVRCEKGNNPDHQLRSQVSAKW